MLIVWENILFLYVNATVCECAVSSAWSLVWSHILAHTVKNIWWACDWNMVVATVWTSTNNELSHMNTCYIERSHHVLSVNSNFYFKVGEVADHFISGMTFVGPCEIWGSHSNGNEHYCLLGCDMWLVDKWWHFRRTCCLHRHGGSMECDNGGSRFSKTLSEYQTMWHYITEEYSLGMSLLCHAW